MSKSNVIQIRMGGYGPATTGFSKALKFIGDRLIAEFGDQVDIKYVWNIMEFGYRSEDILWLVESGVLSLGYQSSSYLTDRVPELGFVDLPFLFSSREQARGAMDGALGARLSQAIEDKVDYRIVGWFENGFRHISNRLRPVRSPCRSCRHDDPRAAERNPEADIRVARRRAAASRSHRSAGDDRRRHHRRAGKSARQHRDLWRAQISSLPYADRSLLHLAADLHLPRAIRFMAEAVAGRRCGVRQAMR